MKKQTAVEWLIDQLEKYELYSKVSFQCLKEIEQAKAMEKEQIVDFALNCQEMFKHQIEEEYNETYGGDK